MTAEAPGTSESAETDESDQTSSGWSGEDGPWETPVQYDREGEPIGVSLYLSKEALSRIGIELTSQSSLQYRLGEDNFVVVEER